MEEQFGNPLEQEIAIVQLDSMSWDREKETLNMFRSRASSLFIKARISSWILQRGYILRAFNTSMRERLLQPASADELWRLAYNIIVTDDSIKTTKSTTKDKKKDGDKKNSKDLKDVECFTCHEKGHYAPQCPNKDKANKPRRWKKSDEKEDNKDKDSKDDDVCFRCGGEDTVRRTALRRRRTRKARKQNASASRPRNNRRSLL